MAKLSKREAWGLSVYTPSGSNVVYNLTYSRNLLVHDKQRKPTGVHCRVVPSWLFPVRRTKGYISIVEVEELHTRFFVFALCGDP